MSTCGGTRWVREGKRRKGNVSGKESVGWRCFVFKKTQIRDQDFDDVASSVR